MKLYVPLLSAITLLKIPEKFFSVVQLIQAPIVNAPLLPKVSAPPVPQSITLFDPLNVKRPPVVLYVNADAVSVLLPVKSIIACVFVRDPFT